MIYEIFAFLLAPFLRLIRRRREEEPKRILVIQLAKIGDFVNSSGLISSLRKSYPDVRLDVVVAGVNQKLAICNPDIDNVIVAEKNGYHGLFGRIALARKIAETKCDLVVSLNCSATITVSCVLANVPQRISVLGSKKSRSRFLRRYLWDGHVEHKPERLIHQTYNDLLGLCGAASDCHVFLNKVYARDSDLSLIDDRFPKNESKYIGIGVSSANKLKELPVERVVETINGLIELDDATVLLVGGREDKEKAEAVIKECPVAIDVTGDYSIDMVPYLIERFSLFIGVDSGLTYIADALGVPVVSISGPCNMAETRPLGKKMVIIQNLSLPCMPCSYIHDTARTCKTGALDCILSIKSDEISNAASRLLDV